ncbi:MAG TPA: 4Fe-4S dicluster-binding protein, partial [Polyangia bacterium]|nr:4Fe-4S dicluster-binding protein [Polyangia bacterium]
SWKDAVEFLLLGATTVQVCTAVMHYGFRIVEDLIDGLDAYLDEKGFRSVRELTGRAKPNVTRWEELDLNYQIIAHIDYDKCIGCGLCYLACNDGAHQSIAAEPEHGRTRVTILEDHCVGCNLCNLVCPVEGCITMRRVETGKPPMNWKDYQRQASGASGG